ncbi:MAG: PDZ domain-containing protein [Gammaproteobacteria bacterium]|nr:PDZ domain-containing protein [Gammaproteobacteria bacterium]MYC25569.1 PDZ domain-containing protein [Gammaproteobacteria bacterium]
MKTSNILAFIVVVLLVAGLQSHAEEEAVTQNEEDATQELQAKEASARAAKAKFDEAQKLFDEAAVELLEARDHLKKVSAELQDSQSIFDDVLILTNKLTDQIAPVTLNLVRDTMVWNFQRRNDGVIGVALEDASGDGVLVKGVMDTAPAYIAGVEAGDVILSIDDVQMLNLDDPVQSAFEVITSRPPGTIVRLMLQRNDDEKEVEVATIDRLSMEWLRAIGGQWHAIDGVTINNAPVDPKIWNIITETFPGAENKIFVMEIEEDLGSYFDVEYGVLVVKAPDVDGIQAGDILLKIDDKPIRSISQAFQHKHNAGIEVELQIKRKKKEKRISLEKDKFSLRAILE